MSGPDVRILSIDDRAGWQAATQGALPTQLWSHAAGLAADGWHPRLAVVTAGEGRLLLPFHLRPVDGTADIATLPGLSGALVQGNAAQLFDLWFDHARAQGWVASYIQLAPTVDVAGIAAGQVRSHNALFVFDTADWNIDRSVGVNMRRSIRLGDRLGAGFVTNPAQIAAVFDGLHAATLARTDTRRPFGPAAIAEWFRQSGTLAFAAELDGRIVAAQLGRAGGGWADLHLAGASDEGRALQAWLIAQAVAHCRDAGIAHVNIGGYGHPGDGLHQMKSRLGAREMPLRSLRQVHDPVRFRALCAAAGADPDDAYFPPYRRAS